MTLRKLLLVFFLCYWAQPVWLSAQIGVGPIEQVRLKPGTFTSEELAQLAATKTVFLYQEGDDVALMKKAIEAAWDFTEISLVPYADWDKIDFTQTSVFSLGGFNTNTSFMPSGMSYDNTHLYLHLWMKVKNDKGKEEKKTFCRIEMHPTFADYAYITDYQNRKKLLEYLYTDANLKNWQPGFLQTYLKVVNQSLTAKAERWLFMSDADPEIAKLASSTLFVPDYTLVNFNKFNGDESKRHDEDDLFDGYPYSYQIVAADALSQIILEANEPIYFLVYIKSSTDKYLTIYNSQTGNILYSQYKGASYNVKKADFKAIAKAIKKSSK